MQRFYLGEIQVTGWLAGHCFPNYGFLVHTKDVTKRALVNNSVHRYHCDSILSQGSAICLDILIKSGCKLEEPNSEGNTPLHLATQQGYNSCVVSLLQAGVNRKVTNNRGQTAEKIASLGGHVEVLQTLAHWLPPIRNEYLAARRE